MFLHSEIIFSGFVFWSSHMFIFLSHGYFSLSLVWLKGDLSCFSVVFFSSSLLCSCGLKQSPKFKKVKVRTKRNSILPQKTMLLKRLIGSPLILRLCDTKLHHHVTQLRKSCLVTSYTCKNWLGTAALLLLAAQAQACASWRIRALYMIRR